MAIFGRRFPIRGVTINKQLAGTIYNVTITESASATDSEDDALVAAATITESTTATDTESEVLIISGSITESATAIDVSDATEGEIASIIELANATDTEDAEIVPPIPTPTPSSDTGSGSGAIGGRYNQRDAEEEMRRKMIGQEEDDFMFISGIITRIINNN